MYVVFSGGSSCISFSVCSYCSEYSGGIKGSRDKASLSGTSPTPPFSSWSKWHRNFLTYSAMTWSKATDYISRCVQSNHKALFLPCLRQGRTETLCCSWNSVYAPRIQELERWARAPSYLRVAGRTWLCSVTPRIRKSRHLCRTPDIVTQKKVIFST